METHNVDNFLFSKLKTITNKLLVFSSGLSYKVKEASKK